MTLVVFVGYGIFELMTLYLDGGSFVFPGLTRNLIL